VEILTNIIVQNSFQQKLHILNLILILLLSLFFVKDKFFNSEKIVYVDNEKLFNSFQMTKDLRNHGEIEFNSRKKEVDSLYLKIQENLNETEKESLMKLFISKRDELDQFNQTFALGETEKIWNRINSYVKLYSLEKECKIVIGSNSNREVLYANKDIDVTTELINYINKKYEGVK
jgi:outer membrane protein